MQLTFLLITEQPRQEPSAPNNTSAEVEKPCFGTMCTGVISISAVEIPPRTGAFYTFISFAEVPSQNTGPGAELWVASEGVLPLCSPHVPLLPGLHKRMLPV